MPLDLCDYETRTQKAVSAFWQSRDKALAAQRARGVTDAGTRGAVTAGANMNGFIQICVDVVRRNGLPDARVETMRMGPLNLPGYFRPTKEWDILIFSRRMLVAALEFKSQVGSFGNNANNRTEEAIGTAVDLWTAYREGGLGKGAPRPFVGWLMLIEDAEGSRRPSMRDRSPHFPTFPEFNNQSYIGRYHLLCEKLVRENLYTAAALIASPRDQGASDGLYSEVSPSTGLRQFLAGLAGHAAAVGA